VGQSVYAIDEPSFIFQLFHIHLIHSTYSYQLH